MAKIIFRPSKTPSAPVPPQPPANPQIAMLSPFPFLRRYYVTVGLVDIVPPANYVSVNFNIKDTTSDLDVTVENLTQAQLTGSEEFTFRSNDASYNDTRVYLIYTLADSSTQTVELQVV